MELRPVKEIPKKEVSRRRKYEELVQEFLKSGQKQTEVVWEGQKPSARTVYQQLLKVCKRVEGVKVVRRGERIFLVRT